MSSNNHLVLMNITIRKLNETDLDAITHLMQELGYETTNQEMAERLLNFSQNSDYNTILAVCNNQIAGMMGLFRSWYWKKNGCFIRIQALVVDSRFRNLGVGKILIQEAENWAKDLNANAIILNSGLRPERKIAYQFYQNLGFEIKSSGFVKEV
jgi:GNAT superfamily N-acetyltransferase